MVERYLPAAAAGAALGFYTARFGGGMAVISAALVCGGVSVALSFGPVRARTARLILVAGVALVFGWGVSAGLMRNQPYLGFFGNRFTGEVVADSVEIDNGRRLYSVRLASVSDQHGNRASAAGLATVIERGTQRRYWMERVAVNGNPRRDGGAMLILATEVMILDQPAWIFQARRRVVEAIIGIIDRLGRPAGLVTALILGIYDDCDRDLRRRFLEAGAVHLLALSGMHLQIILLLLALVIRPRGHPSRMALFGLVSIYVFLVGPKPSILRAYLMFAASVLAGTAGRRVAPVHIFSLAFLAHAALLPSDPATWSFQLSYGAVVGIVVLSRPLELRLRRALPMSLAAGVGLALAAQAGSTPIALLLTSRLYPHSLLAGLILGPMTSCFLAGGLVFVAASAVGIEVPLLSFALHFLYDVQVVASEILARFPALTVGQPAVAAGVAAAVIVVTALIFQRQRDPEKDDRLRFAEGAEGSAGQRGARLEETMGAELPRQPGCAGSLGAGS